MDKKRQDLINYLTTLQGQLKNAYGNAYQDVFKLTEIKKAIKNGEDFTWNGNPTAERKLDEQLKLLSNKTETLIRNGISGAWKLGESDSKDRILQQFGKTKYQPEVNATMEAAVKSHRDNVMNAYKFANQKQGGLTLSNRVWNLSGNAKKEMEIMIQNRIKEGKGADKIATEIEKYLNNPDALFRRVRDKDTGELELSKAAKAYRPGQGVYRSAYKNALRLVSTEINNAYRRAEWESYQNNPLITGFRIQLNNNHTTLIKGIPTPFTDICDDLQGEYPKSFLWQGWHPQCRCVMFPIRISDDDLEARWIARMENKLQDWKPTNEIKQPPKALNDWINKNAKRIENAKQLPYWIKDNTKFVSLPLNEINMITQQLFTTYKEFSNSGGKIELMEGYTKKSDHKDLLAIARIFAEKGEKVQITTDLHFKDEKYKKVFGELNGTKYEHKCPDLIINGKFYEYESYMKPFKKEKISHMIKKGSIQSSRIIINNNKGASDRYIRRNIIERINDKNFKYDIDELWLYERGKVRLLFKKQ